MACKGCEERLKKLKEMREIYMRRFRGGAPAKKEPKGTDQ